MKRGMPPGGVNPVPVKVALRDKLASPKKEQVDQPHVPSFAAAELNSRGTLLLQASICTSHAACPGYFGCQSTMSRSCCDCKKGRQKGCCKCYVCSHGQQRRLTASPVSADVSKLMRVCSLVAAAGAEASEQAQPEKQDSQEGLSTIQEGSEDVPSSNVHHPILGMKSPMQRLRSQGVAAELAYSTTHITATTGPAVSCRCNILKATCSQSITQPPAMHCLSYQSAAVFPVLVTTQPASKPHAASVLGAVFERKATYHATAVTIMILRK